MVYDPETTGRLEVINSNDPSNSASRLGLYQKEGIPKFPVGVCCVVVAKLVRDSAYWPQVGHTGLAATQNSVPIFLDPKGKRRARDGTLFTHNSGCDEASIAE